MKGIILAGGEGTRLRPLTLITNKHLLPVYNKVMIEYPLQTLIDLGCDDILIISGGEHIGGFAEYLGDGSNYGVRLTYRVQPKAGGVAQALSCAQGFIKDYEHFPVILGDNYFASPPRFMNEPAIYVKEVENANRFGIYQNGRVVEKPKNPDSNLAVTGFYVYDFRVFEHIKHLQPSGRGELEIADINDLYVREGCKVITYEDFWSDMGTFDSLIEVANNVKNSSV